MNKKPKGRAQWGWDLFFAGYVLVLGLNVWAQEFSFHRWVAPLAVFFLWYLVVGHRALVTRQASTATVYICGAIVILSWGVACDAWLTPLQGVLFPAVWWLYLPNRRRAAAATVAVCGAAGASIALYWHLNPWEAWSQTKVLVYTLVVPLILSVASILAGIWADTLLRWGRARASLVGDLRETEEQRIALVREAAVVEERLRMSREIHDTVSQDVSGLRFLVERARRQTEDLTVQGGGHGAEAPRLTSLQETLGMIATAVDTVLTETRDLISATVPVPSGSSLKDAVERIASRFAHETGIEVHTDVVDGRLARESEVVFVRCLQEGLSNIRKHSKASRAWLAIELDGGSAVMTLSDNGCGMPDGVTNGFGLPGMTDRVGQAGGVFDVTSPGLHQGVTIQVRMPTASLAAGNSAAESPAAKPTRGLTGEED